jgi:hypothetical protein
MVHSLPSIIPRSGASMEVLTSAEDVTAQGRHLTSPSLEKPKNIATASRERGRRLRAHMRNLLPRADTPHPEPKAVRQPKGKESPQPRKSGSKARILPPPPFAVSCGVGGCTKTVYGLGNLRRHRLFCGHRRDYSLRRNPVQYASTTRWLALPENDGTGETGMIF